MSFGTKLKNVFSSGGDEEVEADEPVVSNDTDDKGFLTESVETVRRVTKLNMQQRVIGFIICLVVAALFIVVGCAIAGASPPAFAVLFSIGTIAAVCCTFFLMGPIDQARKLIDIKNTVEVIVKIVAIVAFVLAVILAIVCGVLNQAILAVFLAIIQVIALIVYSITLIPFATQFIIKGCKSLGGYLSG